MDLNKVVNALGSSGALGGFAGGVAGGALTGALMSKKGKKHAKTLLTAGGLAAVGGLAWKAYQSYQQGQQAQQPAPRRCLSRWLSMSSALMPVMPSRARVVCFWSGR